MSADFVKFLNYGVLCCVAKSYPLPSELILMDRSGLDEDSRLQILDLGYLGH